MNLESCFAVIGVIATALFLMAIAAIIAVVIIFAIQDRHEAQDRNSEEHAAVAEAQRLLAHGAKRRRQ